jgi:hypothetical protein
LHRRACHVVQAVPNSREASTGCHSGR